MTPSETPNPAPAQQAALTCYLNALLAIARCMEQVCPQAGLVYSNRLQRLPRRLGFDATPKALESSREALEADLADYAEAAGAWVQAGTALARTILANASTITETLSQEDEFHAAMIEGLAEQMEASAELDEDSQIRPALRRYASGLRSYLRRRKKERLPLVDGLEQHAKELDEWLSGAKSEERIDELTGLLNRPEAERQLRSFLKRGKTFCVPVFQWAEAGSIPSQLGRSGADQILKEFADRIVTMVRPRDIVCRWGSDQIAVIFECPATEARERARKIAEWLSDKFSVVVEDKVKGVEAHAVCAVVEPVAEETFEQLAQRIDEALQASVGERVA